MSREKKYNFILLLICLVSFFSYSYLLLSVWLPNWSQFGHLIFNWPDANANYFFSMVFAKMNTFAELEPLNYFTQNLFHTRSINVIEGNLVPMTFLPALVIFGMFAKVLGSVGILFLTPLLAVLSGYFIFVISKNLFKSLTLSFLLAILFMTLAPILYFANIVMLPTILFIFLLLGGWTAISYDFLEGRKQNFLWGIGVLSLSLSVLSRPTEIVWVALLTLFIFYINKHKIGLFKFIWAIVIFVALAIIFLSLNKSIYGGYFTFGYLNLQSGGTSSEISEHTSILKLLFAPFGFDAGLLISNIWKYLIKIILPHFALAIVGYIILFIKLKKNKLSIAWKKYLLFTPFIFFFVLLYYGSWRLADPLVRELNTISISYVRYFLPLYIWLLPATGLAMIKLFYRQLKMNQLAYYVVLLAMIAFSFKVAYLAKNDGLVATADTLDGYYQQYQKVTELAPLGSVMLTERSDKIFFPKYKVVVPQGDLPLWSRLSEIAKDNDIYYFTDKTDSQIDSENEIANQSKLEISNKINIQDNFNLYKIIIKN